MQKKQRPVESAMDPHKLARHYIKSYCKDSQNRPTLVHWRGDFYLYQDGRYRKVTNAEMFTQLTAVIKRHVDAVPLLDKWNRAYQVTSAVVHNVSNALASELHVEDSFDQPAWIRGESGHTNYIALRNGLLDISNTGGSYTLRPLTPHWFSTVALPYDYDAKATCPQWLRFLHTVFEDDEERIQLLQQWFGYLLTPDTSQQSFMVLEGEGANGKSVVLEVVEALLGHKNVSHVPVEVFGERFQLTVTENKLANIAPEVNETARISEGALKQFTGGDVMYHDRKGRDGFDTKPTARLMLATNNRPPFGDRSDGIWRRMRYLPFQVTIQPEDRNPNLARQLKTEVAGILNWALEGHRLLYANGRFIEPAASVKAIQEYRRESNPAGIFLREQCHRDDASRVPVDALYQAYREWAKDNGHSALNNAQFGKEVGKVYRNVKKVRPTLADGSRPWMYLGVVLGPDVELKAAA
jgi:putative DNA primase/helicase